MSEPTRTHTRVPSAGVVVVDGQAAIGDAPDNGGNADGTRSITGRQPTTPGQDSGAPTPDTRGLRDAGDLHLQSLAPFQLAIREASRYCFITEHARGGLGTITRAYDAETGREVALKQLHHRRKKDELRFTREALITARLQHPSIVPLYDAGRWPSGRPFYTMKFVEGQSLKHAIASKKTLDERMTLLPHVIAIADAMAFAHSRGIIHRDLKPSNVMLGDYGETLVVDWGLAIDLNADIELADPGFSSTGGLSATMTGEIVGTPAFMAPEQARGERVDERADVYALGVVLYNLLAGRLPHIGRTAGEVIRLVCSGSPKPVREIEPDTPSDLAAIVAKSMHPNPADRYSTAKALALDLRHYLNGNLISVYRYGALERLRRCLRRHRPVAIVSAILGGTLLLTAGYSARRIVSERDQARNHALIAQQQRDQVILGNAQSALATDPTATIAWLKIHRNGNPDLVKKLSRDAQSRGVARHILEYESGRLRYLALDPASNRMAVSSPGGSLALHDIRTGARVACVASRGLSIPAFPKDGRFMAYSDQPDSISIWRGGSLPVSKLTRHDAIVYALAAAPNGRFVASGDAAGTIKIADLKDKSSTDRRMHIAAVRWIEFSPDGATFVSTADDGRLILWRTTSREATIISEHKSGLTMAVFSNSGRYLAWGSRDGTLFFRDLRTGDLSSANPHNAAVTDLAISANGDYVLSTGYDGTVSVWRPGQEPSLVYRSDVSGPLSASISYGGDLYAVGDGSGVVRLYSVRLGLIALLRGHSGPVPMLKFGDSSAIVSVSTDGTARIWDISRYSQSEPSGKNILRGHTDATFHAVFSPDGSSLATDSRDKSVRVWSLRDNARQLLHGHQELVYQVAFAPSGMLLASASWDRSARVWDTRNGATIHRVIHDGIVRHVAWSSDSHRVATAGADGVVVILDLESGRVRRIEAHSDEVYKVEFIEQDKAIISAGRDGTIRVHKAGTSRIVARSAASFYQLVVSSALNLAVAGDHDGVVHVIDWRLGIYRFRKRHSGAVRDLSLSADGRSLAAAFDGGAVAVWDLASGEELARFNHEGPAQGVAVSSSGDFVASVGSDGALRVWRRADGDISIHRVPGAELLDIAISPSDNLMAATANDGAVRLWPSVEVIGTDGSSSNRPLSAISSANVTYGGIADERVHIRTLEDDKAIACN